MFSNLETRREQSPHNYTQVSESYETRSSNETTYRSAVSPRHINVQRSRTRPFGATDGVTTRIYQSIHTSGSGHQPGGLAALVSGPGVPIRGGGGNVHTALVGINSTRQRDKRDLERLNDKFAQYVEKVRFLEAQNRKLQYEIDYWNKNSKQGSSRIKEMYNIEMRDAQNLIDDTKAAYVEANRKALKAEQGLQQDRARLAHVQNLSATDRKEIDGLERQIAENQAQIALFRRRIDDIDDEARRYKEQAKHLSSEISRLQQEIHNERANATALDVEKIYLEDCLNTTKQTHEAELANLRSHSVSTDLDPSRFFRNELVNAIREIRSDYEAKVENERNALQNNYSLIANEVIIQQQRLNPNQLDNVQHRVQEERLRKQVTETQNSLSHMKATNETMRNSISEMQRKLHELQQSGGSVMSKLAKDIEEAKVRLERANQEFNELTNMKTSLEKEITHYRELLESNNGLRGCVDRIEKIAEQNVVEQNVITNVVPRNTSITRTYYREIGGGGVSSLITSTPTASNSYQTLSTGFRSTLRDSFGSNS